jgi:hypothetical protein
MKKVNENIIVIEAGTGNCKQHEYLRDFEPFTPDNILKYKRICKHCGLIEEVTEEAEPTSYLDTYNKFYKKA